MSEVPLYDPFMSTQWVQRRWLNSTIMAITSRGTSLVRKRLLLGSYNGPEPGPCGGPSGADLFYERGTPVAQVSLLDGHGLV